MNLSQIRRISEAQQDRRFDEPDLIVMRWSGVALVALVLIGVFA